MLQRDPLGSGGSSVMRVAHIMGRGNKAKVILLDKIAFYSITSEIFFNYVDIDVLWNISVIFASITHLKLGEVLS